MKVLIVNNMAPFIWGGAEFLAEALRTNLQKQGHESEVLRIPFEWDPPEVILSQMLMVRALELPNVDRVIALKFPAYLIRHPHKTLWIMHQYRQAYDLYDTDGSNLTGEMGKDIKSVIEEADQQAFAESRKLFVNSPTTQSRLQKYSGVESRVLICPVNDSELFSNGKHEDYMFVGGRVNLMKRQHLLLEALALADSSVKLIIAGPPDHESDAQRLQEITCRLGLQGRVKLDLRMLSREEYAIYMRNSLCAASLPFDEDSMSYVAMEAATAQKSIVTTTDSGGVLALVKSHVTGWVAPPDPQSLSEVLSDAFRNRATTIEYGQNAKQQLDLLGINWMNTIETLLQ
ncbi:glycosyltransferase [Aureliella helgolandensis]|uniref:D-inositol-3-phosphate glycosyltransferase n=1 Tax=Aureliella helgolandensis TaxID=2527968 RepID=A0A518G4G5_9BACT|nr:glycosyltransferase [Aureliella helgolandensis]QDV23486.1 D-inositol-3-phosphate glycosyltransferase [Aureliella helgolandensis]